MKILQLGIAKSGNFWLYNIIQNILKESQIEIKSYISKTCEFEEIKNSELSHKIQNSIDTISIKNDGVYYGVSSAFNKKIKNIDEYISNTTHVWSHSPVTKFTDVILGKFDKVVYIIRDPRDVMLSMSNFVMTQYMKKFYPNKWKSSSEYVKYNLISRSTHWNQQIVPYLNKQYKNFYICFYEKLLCDFDNELENLLNYLSINLSKNQKKRIGINTRSSFMSKLHPNHVNIAELYKWKKILTRKQNEIFLSNIRSTVKDLGYSLYKESEFSLPSYKNTKFKNKINKNYYYWKEKFQRNLIIKLR